MIALFDRMTFEMEEALQSGVIEHGRYIPGFTYIMSILFSAVIMIGFFMIVLRSKWYDDHEDFIINKLSNILIPIEIFLLFLIELYNKEYDNILIFLFFFDILLIIAHRKEFRGFRRWLDEKFGWLF